MYPLRLTLFQLSPYVTCFDFLFSSQANQAINALKAGAKGSQACIDAGVTVSSIISDLDTTMTFASVGSVASEPTNDSFADHR